MIVINQSITPRTFFSTPVAKNATIGTIAMIPMSPTKPSISCSKHQRAIVNKQTNVTQYCVRVKDSLVGRIGRISISPSPSGERAGRYITSNSSQMSTMEIMDTGSATANQLAQSSLGSIAARAIRFCGDDIGELWPPMLAAKAMASCRDHE